MRETFQIRAVVLAAGQSSRMQAGNKLLTDFRGQALVTHILQTLALSGFPSPILVTGQDRQPLEALVAKFEPQLVHNPKYRDGLSNSLQRGISKLPKDCDAALICLADMPLISAQTIQALTTAFNPNDNRSICIPTYKTQRGHPVLISRRFFTEIHQLTGDIGAKPLFKAHPDQVAEIPVNDKGILQDLDTAKAFSELA